MLSFIDRHCEEIIAGAALIIMSCLVFVQVVMRYAFNAPLSWSDEVAVYCMEWSVYLSAAWAVRERAHIRVLNLIRLFPKPVSLWCVYISDLVWLFASLFICWQGVLLHVSLREQPYTSPVLAIDQKWPYLAIAVGFGLMSLRLIQAYYRWFRYGEPLLPETSATSAEHCE